MLYGNKSLYLGRVLAPDCRGDITISLDDKIGKSNIITVPKDICDYEKGDKVVMTRKHGKWVCAYKL